MGAGKDQFQRQLAMPAQPSSRPCRRAPGRRRKIGAGAGGEEGKGGAAPSSNGAHPSSRPRRPSPGRRRGSRTRSRRPPQRTGRPGRAPADGGKAGKAGRQASGIINPRRYQPARSACDPRSASAQSASPHKAGREGEQALCTLWSGMKVCWLFATRPHRDEVQREGDFRVAEVIDGGADDACGQGHSTHKLNPRGQVGAYPARHRCIGRDAQPTKLGAPDQGATGLAFDRPRFAQQRSMSGVEPAHTCRQTSEGPSAVLR
jgi:hypothetical protein